MKNPCFEMDQLVTLQVNFPELSLRDGDVGRVVYLYDNRDVYDVEFHATCGEILAVLILKPDEIGPLDGRTALHTRRLSGGKHTLTSRTP